MKNCHSILLVIALIILRVNAQNDWETIDVVTKDKLVLDEIEAPTTQSVSEVTDIVQTVSNVCPILKCNKICPFGNKIDNNRCMICDCECCTKDDCVYDCEYGRKINEYGNLECECASEPPVDICKAYCMNVKTETVFCPMCPLCFCNSVQSNHCPPIECNTVCVYGYLKDYNGCNTCKCQPGANDGPYSDPCDKCNSHEQCKMIDGYAVCVPYSTPSHTVPPILPPKCPAIVCGENCPCDHFVRSDGCTVCRCANACYGVACPPYTVCFPEYTFQFYTGKFEVKPSCRRIQ